MLEFAQNKKQLKWMKKKICHYYKKEHSSVYVCPPLTECSRIYYKDDEHCIEYGFLKGDYTVDDFNDIKEDMWCYIDSWYDCTGEWFTIGISLHINPNGKTSYVHYYGLDV